MKPMISVIIAILPFVMATIAIAAETEKPETSKQSAHTFETQIVKTVRLNYLLFLPEGYGSDPEKKYPMILFLHGAGERGNDLEKVKVHGIPKIVEQQKDFPFIAVSPQCPARSWWSSEVEALNALLDNIVANYAVDLDRIYLTGLSMGGYGTWELAMEYPERFAAIAPICGGGDPEEVSKIKDIPVWVFHGEKDNLVKPEESKKMVKALEEIGADVKFTLYPEAEHDSWTETYNNPELYKWFLEHSK